MDELHLVFFFTHLKYKPLEDFYLFITWLN